MFFEKLKKRWGVTSNFQVAIIFTVFAITGTLSAKIAKPVCEYFGIFPIPIILFYIGQFGCLLSCLPIK